MESERKRQAIIKKINVIYKKGYLPSREIEKYSELHTCLVNCFGHACFNLSNEKLKELESNKNDLRDFFRNFNTRGTRNIFSEIQNRIKQVGLKMERSSLNEKIQKNQWKVAYYIQNDIFAGNDLHFMIQTEDGRWTSKIGTSPEIEVFKKLPEVYHDKYHLSGVYKITNPYVKLEDNEDMEM